MTYPSYEFIELPEGQLPERPSVLRPFDGSEQMIEDQVERTLDAGIE